MIAVGIDASLVDTGVAVIRDGKVILKSTIHVEGDKDATGPRYALLRRSLETLFTKRLRVAPDIVAVEQPEHTLRKFHGVSRNPGAIFKLYGAFAVCYAECQRLWPKTKCIGVLPISWKGTTSKELTASIIRARYGVVCATEHETDALGLADFAWERLEDERRAQR